MHLDVDSPLGDARRGLEGDGNHRTPRHDGHVPPSAGDPRRAELDRHVTVGDLVAHEPVAAQRLEEENRIGVADRAEKHPLGVGGRRRGDEFESGHLGEHRLEPVGVQLRGAHPATVGCPDRHLGVVSTVRPVAPSGELVADLVKRLQTESEELQLRHRHEAGRGQPDRRADDHRLGGRRVDDALGAEPLL